VPALFGLRDVPRVWPARNYVTKSYRRSALRIVPKNLWKFAEIATSIFNGLRALQRRIKNLMKYGTRCDTVRDL
jgi:hypothetical protein